ncbi:Nramp family divalent metal transporter [Gilvibacter sp.]|uniref:Nramp family divalent metal transporter n=1 Tax=Gilvibacter sp. TaxID=2729997 RepID=UPI0025C49822|nr:Nramp family divalent metal transporter [Gilvibacter sp.]NQX76565.1 Nramp family divalent metal transporter [Gilvibacter sp.]
MQWVQTIRKLGPGFLFAGAAIGVSHLVQSTRAGADFGLGLLWALLLINLAKYPFFEFGPRYAMATGESLLEGYKKLGRSALIAYFLITLATMFTIQTAVTIVTSGIASSLFGGPDTTLWSAIITGICFLILILGRYRVLDSLMKIIIICLTISTLIAVALALSNSSNVSWEQQLPDTAIGIGFLIAFMGWMPAPLDISIWHSMWTLEKKKITDSITPKQSRFDFNVGYIATVILAICFLLLGGLVMFGSGQQFSSIGGVFATQLIEMYTVNLGDGTRYIIGIAALTTMFSTTLTTLDASPRAMARTTELLREREMPKAYLTWLIILVVGTTSIFVLLIRVEGLMGVLIEVATVLSFLTAPFYAGLNMRLVTSKHMPEEHKPSKPLYILAWIGMITLIGFSVWYLFTL